MLDIIQNFFEIAFIQLHLGFENEFCVTNWMVQVETIGISELEDMIISFSL